jgi:hypothetical protein
MSRQDKDSFTLDGAIAMAAKIRRLWQEKGHTHDVHTWVEPIDVKLGAREKPIMLYQVRSNLVNGLPPRKVAVAA